MQSNVYVTASGPALSLLLYENTMTPGYQMGFLLGAVVNQVIDTISDSQMRGEKTETIVNISSILPIPRTSNIVSPSGKIDREKLHDIVKSEKSQQQKSGETHDIVGWYSFTRNSDFQMSMRENAVHRQLAEMAKDFSQDITPELFVLCLLSNSLMSKATHVFKHSFMRFLSEKKTYDLIPLQIHNLGMPHTTQYQTTACAPSRASLLKRLFESIGPQKPGDLMLQVQSKLQLLLNERVQQLSKIESQRIGLEEEVETLKKKLESKLKAQQTSNQTSSHGRSISSKAPVEDQPRQRGKQNCLNRNQSQTSQMSKSDNNVINEPTSPVFKMQQRRNRQSRSKSPDY